MTIEVCLCYFDGLCSISLTVGVGYVIGFSDCVYGFWIFSYIYFLVWFGLVLFFLVGALLLCM